MKPIDTLSAPTQNPRPSPVAGATGDAARECVGAVNGLRIPLVPEMLAAGVEACAALRARISNVRFEPYSGTGPEPIAFNLDGAAYVGVLRGRNRYLSLGFDEETDRAVAVRVLVDGDARPTKS